MLTFLTTSVVPTRFATVLPKGLCPSKRCRRAPRAKIESAQTSLGKNLLASVCLLGAIGPLHTAKFSTLALANTVSHVESLYVEEVDARLNGIPEQENDMPPTPSTENQNENHSSFDVGTNAPEHVQAPATLKPFVAGPQFSPKVEDGEQPLMSTKRVKKSRRVKHGALVLGTGALATLLLVRRRSRRMHEPYSDDENLKVVTMARPVKAASTTDVKRSSRSYDTAPASGPPMDEDFQNIFSQSRAEWEEHDDTNQFDKTSTSHLDNESVTQTGGPSGLEGATDRTNGPHSSIYSYSFRTSRRQHSQTPQVGNKEHKSGITENVHTSDLKDATVGVSGGAFRHMRTEFSTDGKRIVEGEIMEQVEGPEGRGQWTTAPTEPIGYPGQSPSRRKSDSNTEIGILRGPMTGGDLLRRVMGTPLWIVREILVPVWEILSVGWTDTRSRLVDRLEGRSGPFLLGNEAVADFYGSFYDQSQSGSTESVSSKDGVGSQHDQFYDENELSEEERQVLSFQRAAMQAAGQVQSSVKHLFRFFW